MPSAGVNQNAIVLSAAQFLYTELPVRFAANLVRFDQLLANMKQKGIRHRELQNVRDSLMRDFRELRLIDMPKNMRQEAALAEMIQGFVTSHARLQGTMARGVYTAIAQDPTLLPTLQSFLDTCVPRPPRALQTTSMNHARCGSPDSLTCPHYTVCRFFTHRIGSTMLMQHHMGLREKPRREGYVGTIALECNLHEIIHDAVDHASSLFVAQHGFAPNVCAGGGSTLCSQSSARHAP
jgi:hypothetical protein